MLSLLARALLCATVLGAIAWWQRPDGQLHLLFLDTSGDAVLVQTPLGDYVLIDGGSDPAALATLLGRRMPFWRRSLAAVVLTAPDTARLPGQVAALARYRAGIALAPAVLPRGALASEWRRLLADQRTAVRTARAGQALTIAGMRLRVLGFGGEDAAAMVVQLDYGRTSVVLDLAGATDEALLAAARPVSALAYPWQRPPPPALLAAWRPRAIVFTAGYQADEPVLLSTRERAFGGAAVYHPKLNGTIELISDGRRLWVKAER